MKEKKMEVITLLNDGEAEKKEGKCNSWPFYDRYMSIQLPEVCAP